jgi:DNA-binding transcriptional LysR family regulator
VPPGHPLAAHSSVSINELRDHVFVFREPGSGTRRVVARLLEQHGMRESDLREAATLGSNEAVREAVKAGIGVAVLSARSIAQDVRASTLVAVSFADPAAERPIYLIQRKNREPSPVAAAFINHLQTAATEEAESAS